jgi:hypothetical protein
METNDRGQFKISGGTEEEPRKTSVIIVGFPVEILTDKLLNVGQLPCEPACSVNLLFVYALKANLISCRRSQTHIQWLEVSVAHRTLLLDTTNAICFIGRL